jgi:hypothetical protein
MDFFLVGINILSMVSAHVQKVPIFYYKPLKKIFISWHFLFKCSDACTLCTLYNPRGRILLESMDDEKVSFQLKSRLFSEKGTLFSAIYFVLKFVSRDSLLQTRCDKVTEERSLRGDILKTVTFNPTLCDCLSACPFHITFLSPWLECVLIYFFSAI